MNEFKLLKILEIDILIIGVPFFKRKFAVLSQPTLSISKEGENWNITWKSVLPLGITVLSEMNCIDGVEFDYSINY